MENRAVSENNKNAGIKLIYQKAESDDLDAVFSLVQDAVRDMERRGVHQWDQVYPDRAVLEQDIAQGQMTAVWADAGTAGESRIKSGLAAIYVLNRDCDREYETGSWRYPEAPYLVLHRFCVSSRFQNRGLGSMVMEQVERDAAEQGAICLRLDAFTENPAALRMYEKRGFWRTGTVQFRKGLFYLMEKKLLHK